MIEHLHILRTFYCSFTVFRSGQMILRQNYPNYIQISYKKCFSTRRTTSLAYLSRRRWHYRYRFRHDIWKGYIQSNTKLIKRDLLFHHLLVVVQRQQVTRTPSMWMPSGRESRLPSSRGLGGSRSPPPTSCPPRP